MEEKKQDKKQDKDLELKDKKIEEEQMDDVVGGGSSTDMHCKPNLGLRHEL